MQHSSLLKTTFCVRGSDCPFLYQTRTILHQYGRYSLNKSFGTSTVRSLRSIPPESSFLKRKAAEVQSHKFKRESRLTRREEKAFDDLWKLLEKPSRSTYQTSTTSIDHTDTNHKRILEMFSHIPFDAEAEPVASEIDYIDHNVQPEATANIDQIAAKAKQHKILSTETPPTTQPSLTREGAMAEIQDFLRDTAESAPDRSFSLSDAKSADDIRFVTASIVEDVSDSFAAALESKNPRPDIAMWQVAESKVFPLMNLLHSPPQSTAASSPTTKPSTSRSTSTSSSSSSRGPIPLKPAGHPKTVPNPQSTPIHPLISSDLPLIPLLRSAYPSLTLLLLRLYATHHPTSPYALAVLPKIKSLGSLSYILGAHTHLFNTLLSLHWRIYSDLAGMNDLLTEMEANGVEFDLGTWQVLREVMRDRERDLGGRRDDETGRMGRRSTAWWKALDHGGDLHRVGVVWTEVVQTRLEERGVLTGEVMKEGVNAVQAGSRRSARQGGNEDYVVML